MIQLDGFMWGEVFAFYATRHVENVNIRFYFDLLEHHHGTVSTRCLRISDTNALLGICKV